MATEVNNSESDNESRGGRSDGEEPSHNMEGMYAVLAETNNQYRETWYYFIRYDTNVEALEQLYAQLDSIEWVYLESYSTFALDLEHLVSAHTAKELTKVCVNEGSYHRKFDGTLEFINFGFRKRDNNIVRLINVCDTIGFGNIENFIDKEDFDPEDFEDEEEDESESESESEEESSDSSEHPETKSSVRNRPSTKTTQKRDSSEGNSNKQEAKEESKPSSPTNTTKKVSQNKSSLPPPPVPPPSPALTPSQQPNSSNVTKKKSKKKN
jgi:hypothetical protein